jgi:hypothetical protein
VVPDRGVRRREHEPTHAGEARRVEEDDRLRFVRLERGERVRDRVGDAGPRGEMDDGVDVEDGLPDGLAIGQ